MKRIKRIWGSVCAWENLLLAHRKARRGKRRRAEVARFEFNLEYELRDLQRSLLDRTYQPGRFREFTIYDRKRRLICAAPYRDRVVQHALMNIVEPLLDPCFIDDCYACRPSRGTHAAVDRYQRWAQRYAYAMKLDVAAYFPSVDHAIVLSKLQRCIGDPDVLWLFERIVAHAPVAPITTAFEPNEDLVDLMHRRVGLPIGNLTSQFLGNLYLDDLDRYVKQDLRVRAYLRYVDDLILLDDDKLRLRAYAALIEARLRTERLRLHAHDNAVVPVACGLDVLGYRVWPHQRRLRAENGYRFRRRLRRWATAYRAGRVSLGSIRPRIASWIGHAIHADTEALRRVLLGGTSFTNGAGT